MKVVVKEISRVYDGFFKIDKAVVQHERFDGSMTPELVRLNLERGQSVAVLLYDPDRQTLHLIRQFRYPAYAADAEKGWMLEIVAGMVEEGETPIEVAVRECEEEAGFQIPPDRLTHLYDLYVSPGGTSERVTLFMAEVYASDRVGPGGGCDDEGEDIEVVELPLDQVRQMVESGAIQDAKTVLSLLALESRLRR